VTCQARLGSSLDRGRLAAGEGPRGAQPWQASRPLGKEAAAQKHRHACGREPVPGARVLGRSQPALRPRCVLCGGLSSAGAGSQAAPRRSSGWRRSACWEKTIGWCGITTAGIRWSGRAGIPASSTVVMCEREDGWSRFQYRGPKLHWHAIAERPGKTAVVASKWRKASTPPAAHMPNHPWRRSYQDMHPRPARGAA
jgi:hypothetical protein